MNTDGTGFHTCKECHKTESLWNHTTTDHKEGQQLEDRWSIGASSCNSGDRTDQRVQYLMFMMMMMTYCNHSSLFTRDSLSILFSPNLNNKVRRLYICRYSWFVNVIHSVSSKFPGFQCTHNCRRIPLPLFCWMRWPWIDLCIRTYEA